MIAIMKGANKAAPKCRVLGGKKWKGKRKKGRRQEEDEQEGIEFVIGVEKTKESGLGWVIWLFGVKAVTRGECVACRARLWDGCQRWKRIKRVKSESKQRKEICKPLAEIPRID